MSISTIAIVGAGMSGLVCANELSRHGLKVTVFDKGRYPGGRLASRDRDENIFDYGAQYFTVRDSRFRKFLSQLLEVGAASRWNGRFAKLANGSITEESNASPRYVGVPLMRSIAEITAQTIDCRTSHRVTRIDREHGKWTLSGTLQDDSQPTSFKNEDYDFLVLGLPAAQAAELYPHVDLSLVLWRPCVALLLTFDARVNMNWDGVSMDDEVISWVSRDSSKPGRPAGERWVIHASPEWSEENFPADEREIKDLLIKRCVDIFDIELPGISFAKIHKWRYALPVAASSPGCIFDRDSSLAYCGDWCAVPRVEGAFLSGLSVADAIIQATAEL